MRITVNGRTIHIENLQIAHIRTNRSRQLFYTAEMSFHAYSKDKQGIVRELTSYEKEKLCDAIETSLK